MKQNTQINVIKMSLGCKKYCGETGIYRVWQWDFHSIYTALKRNKNECFHCFDWVGSWGRAMETLREDRGERQDTLIQMGLVLTSLWEALFSLPWKESMWLIHWAVAGPCSLTSLSLPRCTFKSPCERLGHSLVSEMSPSFDYIASQYQY